MFIISLFGQLDSKETTKLYFAQHSGASVINCSPLELEFVLLCFNLEILYKYFANLVFSISN